MSVQEIKFELSAVELPVTVRTFLKEADRRCDLFFDSNANRCIPRYLPSDPLLLYSAINYVTQKEMTLGRVFCEWGSGFGIGASLAYLLGYNAYGIEIEPELVLLSKTLIRDFQFDVEILCTSYLPQGYNSYSGHGGDVLINNNSQNRNLAYPGMAIAIEEIDLFYVYPWPDEQELMLSLFDSVAAEGALLIAYYGNGELCIYSKK